MVDGVSATNAGQPAANSSKIQKAAHDFEALMIGELMKHMSDSDDTMMQMAQESLAQSMANTGAFGIAKMVQRQLALRAK